MNIRTLMELLSRYPADLEVCVSGYEGGVTSDIVVIRTHVAWNVNEPEYYGEHEPLDDDESMPTNVETREVLVLGRGRG